MLNPSQSCSCNSCSTCYRNAVEQETLCRNAAFIGAPEFICGIEVKPFTPAMHTLLHIARSPFLWRDIKRADFAMFDNETTLALIGTFLWSIHPDYSPRSRWRRFWFYRSLRKQNVGELIDGIIEYVNEAFADSPLPPQQKTTSASHWSHCAALVDSFGERYGWNIPEVMATPYKVIFQLWNIEKRRRGERPVNQSEVILANWREQYRKQKEAVSGN